MNRREDAQLDATTFPLTSSQREIWYDQQLRPGLSQYNIGGHVKIVGPLDLERLRLAFDLLAQRHDSLRLVLLRPEAADEMPRQAFAGGASSELSLHDFSGRADASAAALEWMQRRIVEPFELYGRPLARHDIVRIDAQCHYWLLQFHHIVMDGWSIGLIIRSLGEIYTTLAEGGEVDLSAPSYVDFIEKDREYAESAQFERQRQYWQERFAQVPAPVLAPRRGVDAAAAGAAGGCHSLVLPHALVARVEALARDRDSSTFQVILAALTLMFARTAGHEEFTVGVPVLNRANAAFKSTSGLFVGVSAVRLACAAQASFAELLQGIGQAIKQDYRHQRFPISEVNKAAGLRQLGRDNLFDVSVSYMRQDHDARFGEARVARTAMLHGELQTPLSVFICQFHADTDVQVDFVHNGAWLDGGDAGVLSERLVRTLEQVLDDPARSIADVALLSAGQRQQVLVDWNTPQPDFGSPACLHELFEAQAARTPDAAAVTHEGRSLTYAQLDERANRLAHHLRALGVKPDDRVALCFERGFDMLLGLLAVLKAGGGYVPLDPAYPPARLTWMLADCAPVALLTSAGVGEATLSPLLAALDPRVHVLRLDDDRVWRDAPARPLAAAAIGLRARHLAYVIYTSGSTGEPKGVMVEHANVTRLFAATAASYGFGADDVWTLFHSFAFDFSVWEIWGALLHGGRLVIVPNAVSRSPDDFHALVCREGVTVLNQTPSAFRHFIAAQQRAPSASHALRWVVFGGEALEPSMLRPWYAAAANRLTHLVNMYGITETTVHVTFRALEPADAWIAGASPIGRRIDDLRLYLLDDRGQPVPVGAVGEIHVGGAGVARGYLNRPALSAQRFVPDPFAPVPGQRMYRSADLGRWLPDGSLEFLGRNDSQVKVRGFRIELGEIEARLSEHPAVRECVVVVRGDGGDEAQLVAYVVPAAAPPEPAALRAHLLALLPDYMVPAAYVPLAGFPLNENGKLDRKALPAPTAASHAGRLYEAPAGEIEAAMAAVWGEVLGIERVGRHDHFFELGGHSLLAIALIERLRRAGLHVRASVLFAAPTLAALAASVDGSSDVVEIPANGIVPGSTRITPALLPLVALDEAQLARIVATVPGGAANVQDIYPLGPLQEGMLYQHRIAAEGDPYLLQFVFGFDSRERMDRFLVALQAVIDRHDMLRTSVLWDGLPEPVQVVWRRAPLEVEELALAGTDVVRQLAERHDLRRFRLDLQQAPLMRACIAHDAANGRWVMLWLFHHLMDDNTSLKRLLGEIDAHLRGQGDALPAPLPFRDYVAQARLGVSREEHELFFREQLGDVTEASMPFGLTQMHADVSEVAQGARQVDAALARRLRDQARRLGVTAASVFHLAWAQVLARVLGRDDVVFGTVLFGRMQGGDGTQHMLGMLINTLPLRVRLGDESAVEALRRTHLLLARLLRHEHAPLVLAQRCSGVAAPAPLFGSILNVRHAAEGDAAVPTLEGVDYLGYRERTSYPLTLSVDDVADRFTLTALAGAGVAPARVCDFMHTALERLVAALESTSATPVRELDVLPPDERRRLLVDWNETPAAPVETRTLHALFERQAALSPQAIAVTHDAVGLSYAELNAQANRLARHLVALGVRPDDRVALCLPRSERLVVAVLAVLKAGAGYVPLDPAYPADRLDFMLRDSAPRVLVGEGALPVEADVPCVDLLADAAGWAHRRADDLGRDEVDVRPEHLAYVIYTSGSTGAPKGVMIEHRQVTRLFTSTNPWFDFGPGDVWTLFHSFAFDFSVWELWGALLHGGRLVVVPQWVARSPHDFYTLLCDTGVTVLNQTPSAFRQLVAAQGDAARAHRLRCVVFGGEALETSSLAPWYARALNARTQLVNMYGITETTVHVTYRALAAADAQRSGPSPIGERIPDLRVYVLDAQRRPVPVGSEGELYVAGAGLARGYLNRPELTAERFVEDPFHGGRMYKTGDLARHRADGGLEFLGRNDFQVKIRGFRIELGEIEAALKQQPGVLDAVVLAREDTPGDKRLVAYYTAHAHSGMPVDAQVLQAGVAARLPAYMLPSAFVRVEAMPLTASGKLDRRALPAPDAQALAVRDYEEPCGETETLLSNLWRELLGVDRVGRHDDFFALGGHSLMAIRVIESLRQAGLSVDVRALFNTPTLAAFSAAVEDMEIVL